MNIAVTTELNYSLHNLHLQLLILITPGRLRTLV